MMAEERIIEELERIYAMLPTIECKGLCWNSCGPIDMSNAERERIEERGVEIQPYTADRVTRWAQNEPLHCAALTEDKKCSVYDIRPLVCRLWGVSESMPCTYGCEPNPGYVRDEDAITALAYSMELGGNTGLVQEMTKMMADPEIAPLAKRIMRGDKGAESELVKLLDARQER